MPAQRPRAAFEPISPDLDVQELLDSSSNFELADRIHCDAIDEYGLERFGELVALHVVDGGKPLIVEGFNERLDSSIFCEKWLRTHYGKKTENARNLTTKSDLSLTVGHYLKSMPLLADQWTASNYKDLDRQRLYLKDIDCPPLWHDHLKQQIPHSLFYLNESPGNFEGPGSTHIQSLDESTDSPAIPIARSGDLMSCLPPEMRAENLMCYIGHEGTYTPSHQEMCASLGHNIMVEASDGSIEYGKPTKPGTSIWFMTETKDHDTVSEYWMSRLGHDIDLEDHFAQINAWKAATFKTYIVEQKPGDFILIPPLAPHQVWNRGTRTMKVAWNRTTVETLDMALNEALPHAKMVCRDEQYKNKAIVYYALEQYSERLRHADGQETLLPATQPFLNDFQHLFALYTSILLSESFSDHLPALGNVEYIPFDSNITCSYCRGNIFNRFLTCPYCSEEEDTYDICMECYAMGRSCACISRLQWVEQFHWATLSKKHEEWRRQILCFTRKPTDNLEEFSVKRHRLGKKTLAEICQEQLLARPWTDITQPIVRREKSIDSENSDMKRKRRKTDGKKLPKTTHCHICKINEPLWKLASCSSCKLSYCYGSLFRAFNMHPQHIMELLEWSCPRCQKICSCAACRRDPTMNPFEPTYTLLGHDTRKVADPRSVESLVDFRVSNLKWLEKAGADDVVRLQKRQQKADEERNRAMKDQSILLEETPLGPSFLNHDDMPVDPLKQSVLSPETS